jgi:hypothetical protein
MSPFGCAHAAQNVAAAGGPDEKTGAALYLNGAENPHFWGQ